MFSSIRQRLLITLLLIIIIVGSITIARSYNDARYEVQELFDAQLAQSARFIQARALDKLQYINPESVQKFLDTQSHIPPLHDGEEDDNDDKDEATMYGHEYERKIAFQIWNSKKQKILHSTAAPDIPLSEKALNPQYSGYSDETHGGKLWRVFSLWDNDRQYVVQIGERYDIQNELVTKISQRLVMPSLISLPVLAFMIWFGIGRGLSPLLQFAREIKQRNPNHLVAVTTNVLPTEIQPLANALNDLLTRLADALEKERRFTDDAAHELRTPLAALKTQAQVALRSTDDKEKQHAIENIITGVDRSTHIVQQLLALARLNPDNTKIATTTVNIYNFTADIIAQHADEAINKKIEISLDGNTDIKIQTEPTVLSMLITNILDNAVKYTPDNGSININIQKEKNNFVVNIVDTGSGISQELQQRVFDRFYRIPGHKVSGCGLGLAIAQQCVQILSGTIELSNNSPNGLIVKVTLPA